MKPPDCNLQNQEKWVDELTDGLDVHRGIAVPRHMSLPGQDGWRTPTVHDYERERMDNVEEGTASKEAVNTQPLARFGLHTVSKIDLSLEKLYWRERIRHFTWTFFTMTMATGGIANVLHNVPYRFHGLFAIGAIFFLFNLVLFVVNVAMISLRFYTFPETLRASYMHPSERLFIPAAFVSFGTVLINISQYGLPKAGPWLSRAMLALFWTNAALAILASSGIYLLMWSTKSFTVEQMTPIWIFPIYPLLIIGPYAAMLCETLNRDDSMDIIIGGFTLQGVGFLVALMIYASFIYRLMTQKLPQASSRPGMFVSVGPSGFTVAGVIGMADSVSRNVDEGFMGDGKLASMILRVMANWTCLWIWGLAFWFFFVSVGAHWSCARQHGGFGFSMTWFSFVFPNSALVTATFAIGKAFRSKAIEIIGCIMTCFLIIAWVLVVGMMMRAIQKKEILWPQQGEDKDEDGFKAPEKTERRSTLSTWVSGHSSKSNKS